MCLYGLCFNIIAYFFVMFATITSYKRVVRERLFNFKIPSYSIINSILILNILKIIFE